MSEKTKPNSGEITRSHKRGKITVQFGELVISSDFDSGNLDRVEESKSSDADTKEFNLWTAPDCAGTEFENCNRTWFYFSVATPVNYGYKNIRFNVQNLNKQSRLYQQGLTPMIKTCPGRGVWERLRDRLEYEPAEGGGLRLSFQINVAESRRQTTYVAFCFPFSYNECQKMLNKLEAKHSSEVTTHGEVTVETADGCSSHTPADVDNRIYFHRELLCYTIENRRVDLITVSSWDGISEEREPRFSGLFPDHDNVRARVFTGKKVFYLTSRVHPGESPSSHVFNGFLHFILRGDDPRAQALRRHFVFKMIPMLNPDGVFNGHYRTDTKGMNLNRVYLDPSPELHPSIFAARNVLLHHHEKGQLDNNVSEPRPYSNVTRQNSCNCVTLNFSSSNIIGGRVEGGSESKLLAVSEKGCTCVCSFSNALSGWCSHETVNKASENSNNSKLPPLSSGINQSMPGTLRTASVNALLADTRINSSTSGDHHHIPLGAGCSTGSGLTLSSPALLTTSKEQPSVLVQQHSSAGNRTRSNKTSIGDNTSHRDDKESVVHVNESEFMLATKQSGVGFYVDLHAHATKRGVFMYGNYFNNVVEQAENMLFPKLISLNSPHLDFEHCVFSEKNMYTADKRDGLSKEGSGRVAMHKATGLIHCYTLECNYNSGRQGNPLTAATMDNGRASPPVPPSPMGHRFSIQDFEQVGRALAVAALDMYQLNPWSRLPTTDFGSLAGVRQSLLQRLRTSRTKKSGPPKKQGCLVNAGAHQQVTLESTPAASSLCSSVESHSLESRPTSNRHVKSPSHSTTSSPSSTASVQACKALLLQRQKALAAIKGSGQIAAEVARVSEAKRKPRGKQVQLKAGLSLCTPLKRATLRSTRSTTLQRQYLEQQGVQVNNIMKPSLQQVMFPLSKPLRIQNDQGEILKDQPLKVGGKITSEEHVSVPVSSSSITSYSEHNPAFKLPFKRKKLLKQRSRNILSGRRVAIAQKDSYSQEMSRSNAHFTASDSEIICKLTRPSRLQLRDRSFTSTQIRY